MVLIINSGARITVPVVHRQFAYPYPDLHPPPRSFVGWLITVVVIVLFSFVFVGSSITGRVPWEVSLMWFGSVINLMWMLVSSYITYLRDWRFPGVVLLSVGTWIIPESIDVWLPSLSLRVASS